MHVDMLNCARKTCIVYNDKITAGVFNDVQICIIMYFTILKYSSHCRHLLFILSYFFFFFFFFFFCGGVRSGTPNLFARLH